MMLRIVCAAVGLQLLVIGSASAQQSTPLKIRGDTTGAPRGCSAASGISAIKAWFAAFNDADSARLARASSTPNGRFVFSIGKFAASDKLIPARTFQELLAYVRERARQHERMTVQEVSFDGWRGRVLQWDPIYFTRSADDLGDKALPGVGKGGYWCGQGVWYLHLAPRPEVELGSLAASPTLAQTPAREGFIDAGKGVKLYYRLVGNGSEPVVLIHGGPGLTSDYLADDLMPMTRNHSLLIYDQRGIGRSTLVSDSTALAAQRYVEDLEAIRKHLGREQLTLLGHSWGVVPATLYAMQYPERVRRMILVATIPATRSGLAKAFDSMAAARDSATRSRMAELSRIREANPADREACREYYKLWFTPFFGASNAAGRMKGNVCAGSPESLKNKPNVGRFTWASLGDWDWTTSLSRARVPTLIIQGDLDPLPIASARDWAAAMPNARLLALKGIGHFPYVETPELFFAAVNQFLKGDWPEGATR